MCEHACESLCVCTVEVPELQSILQQIDVGGLGYVCAQLDHRKQERIQVFALRPQALQSHKRQMWSFEDESDPPRTPSIRKLN